MLWIQSDNQGHVKEFVQWSHQPLGPETTLKQLILLIKGGGADSG